MVKRSDYEPIAEEKNENTSSSPEPKRIQNKISAGISFILFIGLIFFLAFGIIKKEISAGLFIEVGPYRPCEIYDSERNIRVVQTAMGEPSAQWSHQPCFSKQRRDTSVYKLPSASINVNLNSVFGQDRPPILGFGGAFTEASALNFNSLNEKGQKAAMELLFGQSGLGYSLGRVHINSCDFCVKSYSFDDHDMDFNLTYFDNGVTHDVESGMISMMKFADVVVKKYRKEGIKLLASPWSPPYWMKAPTGNDPSGAVHARGMTGSQEGTCLREGTGPQSRFAKSWALYFSRFINAYKALGIDLWAITVQNEPEFPAPWEACSYNPQTEGEFVSHHLGPIMREEHPNVKLFIFDHNKDHAVTWIDEMLSANNSDTQYIDGTAIHWYAGGMDRLLDGAVGSPNMHKLMQHSQEMKATDNHYILGSEACHCPNTGYAGGNFPISWERAERYAHTILADLAAGSNGWIEWNLILDSMGGPNHLGNMCDTTLLAVPHRAKNAQDIPDVQNFEKAKHPFGPVMGDGMTKEELNALGTPAKYIDLGIVVQPMYYYMGHISRHVRPGSRPVSALVEGRANLDSWVFRLNNTSVAGGGLNNLARNGVELTVWPCEGSTRQEFFYNDKKQFQVFGHDWLGNPTISCISNVVDESLGGLTLVDCDDAGGFVMTEIDDKDKIKIVLTNGADVPEISCLLVEPLSNNGGAYGSGRGGSQVVIGNCNDASAEWTYSEVNGQITSSFFEKEGGNVCLTTGWPFLQVGAFDTPSNDDAKKVIVILNEANEAANYMLNDEGKELLSFHIPARSIQTILMD